MQGRDPSIGVELLDADGVHMDRAVNPRDAIALGDHQRLGARDKVADFRRHRLQMAQCIQHQKIRIAEQAETRVKNHLNACIRPFSVQGVPAIAEHGEIVAVDPLQERPHFRDIVRGQFRSRRLRPVDDLLQPIAHGTPILYGGAHVAENRLHVGGDAIQGIAGLVRDLEMHEALGNHAVALVLGLDDASESAAAVPANPNDRVNHEGDR